MPNNFINGLPEFAAPIGVVQFVRAGSASTLEDLLGVEGAALQLHHALGELQVPGEQLLRHCRHAHPGGELPQGPHPLGRLRPRVFANSLNRNYKRSC